jgi:hypothetical protein
MIVTVTCIISQGRIAISALDELDRALASLGLKREIRTPIVPGQNYVITYQAAEFNRDAVNSAVADIASKNAFSATVEFEESVSFP